MINRFGVSYSTDLVHWQVAEDVTFPPDAGDASVVLLTHEEAKTLIEKYRLYLLEDQVGLSQCLPPFLVKHILLLAALADWDDFNFIKQASVMNMKGFKSFRWLSRK
jgi:hypothetical protein